jgi:hypothetical protein
MNDELDRLRRDVERLTAERDQARADAEEFRQQYSAVLSELVAKQWEGITQADLDEALASGVTLGRLLDDWAAQGVTGG